MFYVAHKNQSTQTNDIYKNYVEKSKLLKNRAFKILVKLLHVFEQLVPALYTVM